MSLQTREMLGDTPEAPCYGRDNDKDPYRSAPHKWRSVLKSNASVGASGIDVCDACGGMRATQGAA